MNKPNRADEEEVEEFDAIRPILDYLQSERGHAIVERFITLFEGIKKATLDKDSEMQKLAAEQGHRLHKWALFVQGTVLIGTLAAAVVLALHDKFTPPVGILMGTALGYLLGRRSSG